MALISTRSPAIPIDTLRSLHRLEASVNETNNRLDAHDEALNGKLSKSPEDLLGVASFVRSQLSAGGKVPLNINGLGGQAAQPQYAAVPEYQDLPALAKAEGALSVQDGLLYYFKGASSVTTTPQWVPLGAEGVVLFSTHSDRANHVASTSGEWFYETDRDSLYVADGTEWLYVSGTMLDVVGNKPLDLGGNDVGFEFLGSDDHNLYIWDGAAWRNIGGSASSPGTVTSVGLGMPAEFTVSGSPVTASGTLIAAKVAQNANRVWAGPTSGGAAPPAFRALVASDLPAGVGSVTSVGLAAPAEFTVSGSPVTGSGTLTLAKAAEPANTVYAGPASGGAVAPTFRALQAADLPAAAVQTANTIYAGPATGSPAAPTFRAQVAADIPQIIKVNGVLRG